MVSTGGGGCDWARSEAFVPEVKNVLKNLDSVGGEHGDMGEELSCDFGEWTISRSFPLDDDPRGVSACEGLSEVKPVPLVKRFPRARHAAADRIGGSAAVV